MPAKARSQAAIIGQEPVLTYLRSSIERGRLASAYLFFGPNAVGKRTTAKAFLQSVLCVQRETFPACGSCASCQAWARGTHPDAFFINLAGDAPIGVDDIRTLQKQLSFRPTLSDYRVALLGSTDVLSLEAANALLKTLEEPPHKTVLVLCATIIGKLPLTLRSRCQLIAFQLVPQGTIFSLLREHTENFELAKNVSHVAIGRPGLALNLLQNPEEFSAYQTRVLALLQLLQAPIAERLRRASELLPAALQAARARQELLLLLDLWIWLLRDAILLREHQEEFLVHPFLAEQLRDLGGESTTREQLRHIRLLEKAKGLLLENNVNPHLALEHCLIAL